MTTIELINGECLEVMESMEPGTVDLFMCDLPYGVLASKEDVKCTKCDKGIKADGSICVCIKFNPNLYKTNFLTERRFKKTDVFFTENKGGTFGFINTWDKKINWERFWACYKRLRKNDKSPCLFFCQGKFMAEAIITNPDEFRMALVWDKITMTNFFDAGRRPCYNHEQILVFAKKAAYYNRVNYEGKCPTTIIRSDSNLISLRKTRYHPTEKPVDLYTKLISWYCPPGGLVLDPTAGSCNALVAAATLGRSAIGIEKDEFFYNKGCEKLDKLGL